MKARKDSNVRIKISRGGMRSARQSLLTALREPLANAVEVSKALTPVDTSSLQESVAGMAVSIDKAIVLQITAGGEDYRGQVMTSTGRLGNLVDYAIEQEAIHGFLEIGLATLATAIDNRL